ncbi:ATP-dependent Clp protease ATP-binding subunit [Patescibacteria group bacterium]|nr:ATP-dependent Clp protease ATP-binding subunit [Patescibacteria group bacterium]
MDQNVFYIIGGVCIVSAFLVWDYSRRKNVKSSGGSGPILERFTTDVTLRAQKGELDPVVGRDDEIERVIHILSRRRKNNPLLIGEPGVGKTAIIEGLARRIVKGAVPARLRDKRILMLDLTGIISGTKYRGEFEKRMHSLTEELQVLARSVILFIDEIHMIEQSAGAEGAVSASDILKPALARGDLQAVGATTWKEYEKYIKPDDALNRRFQPVLVGEPSDQDALVIMRGIKDAYEKYHDVVIDDDALEAAVTLSKTVKDRYLPDKAIDLIDEACAKVSIEAVSGHAIAIGVVHAASATVNQRAQDELRALNPLLETVEKLDKDFPNDPAIERVERTIKNHVAEITFAAEKAKMGDKPHVTRKEIEEIVALWTSAAHTSDEQ